MTVGAYISGQRVPASGVYNVFHPKHRIPQEVTLLKDEFFPPCARCSAAVQFTLLRVVTALDKSGWKIIMHALPVTDDEQVA